MFGILGAASRVVANVCRSSVTGSTSAFRHLFSTATSLPSLTLQPTNPISQQVRNSCRIMYRPNVRKRLKKHGLKTRMSQRRSLVMLWTKLIKGRQNLST